MDINDLRKNLSHNQQRIRELRRQMRETLKEQKQCAVEWNEELKTQNEVQRANIRGVKVAVGLSAQPGQIKYRQTAPSLMQAADAKVRVSKIEQLQKTLEGLQGEVNRLEKAEAEHNASLASNARAGGFNDWFNRYGHPKRTAGKEEKFLTYVKPPTTFIRGARSQDGTVFFEAELSNARNARKGTLMDALKWGLPQPDSLH